MRVDGQHNAPAALLPGNTPGTHCTQVCLVPRIGMEGCGKTRPQTGFDSLTVHFIASRYTD